MAAITEFPRGLVSLTGLRDMGEAPKELAGTIAPTIDVTEFLLLNRETLSATPTTTGVTILTVFTVPAGELWYVHAYSGRNNALGAGDAIRFNVGITTQGFFVSLSDSSFTATIAGELGTSGVSRPFWAGPGTSLSILVERFAGVSIGMNVAASISRLRI